MKEILEKVRDKLNSMLDSDKFTNEEILAVSQELDRLIFAYYKFNSSNSTESPLNFME
ncbi:Spo0E family sporulation regulatory protein-aspartic acid phosphatase [Clostridium sp. WILCCON 0269]|uniref:Spo0E family sporulation regulatory protein-aspartic acid phosphatase n=1 Tax=Candidatus Clostridium eludens TaxID=3381663 RepID=A0ABW8SJW3_9CLOT